VLYYCALLEPILAIILKLRKLRHSPRGLGGHQKQKFSLHFPIWRAEKVSLKWKRKFLFLVSCPQGLGQVAELEFGLGQSKTVIGGKWIWSGLGGL